MKRKNSRMNSSDVWKAVMVILSRDLTATAINTWFSDCTPVEIFDNKLVIHTPSDFKRDIITQRFSSTIKSALNDIFACEFELQVLAGDELDSYNSQKESDDSLPEIAGFTFDNFVVGPSNKFAHAAAVAVAENPGTSYNPLFIYGNSGLGKTHLLLAIGQHIHEKSPSKKIAYVKGDDFTNLMVRSIKDNTQEEFRQKYRYVDLFLVDDIQFIAGKLGVQEEFFHTFNTLYEAGKQMSHNLRPPSHGDVKLEDRLNTPFEGGLMLDVTPPTLKPAWPPTRNKAAQLGLILSDEVVE